VPGLLRTSLYSVLRASVASLTLFQFVPDKLVEPGATPGVLPPAAFVHPVHQCGIKTGCLTVWLHPNRNVLSPQNLLKSVIGSLVTAWP